MSDEQSMKHFETPIIEIERFELADIVSVSIPNNIHDNEGDPVPIYTLPDDDFDF